MIKKIGFVLFSLFLVDQTLGMLPGLTEQAVLDQFWPAFLFSALMVLYITGIFAFLGFALPTQKLLPEAYYRIKEPKKLRQYYRSIRADVYKKYLIKFIYSKPQFKTKYFDGKRSGIDHFITNTKKSEFGHLMPFLFITVLMIYVFLYGKYYYGFGLLFFNLVGNFYPIIIQRHHRARLVRMNMIV